MAEETEVLAAQPPLRLLVKAASLLLAALLALAGMSVLVVRRNALLDARPGWRVGLFALAVALAAALALWFLFHAVRLASRFCLPTAGVYARWGKVLFRLPRVRAWWNPIYGIRAIEIPLAEIRHIQLSVAGRSRLTILTDQAAVEIPAATFRVGNYTLDARLRKLLADAVPGSRRAAGLAPLEPKRLWTASGDRRLLMALLGLAIMLAAMAVHLVVFCVAPQLLRHEAVGIALGLLYLLTFLQGAGLLVLAWRCGGILVVDARGLFWENGGNLCFLSWEALGHGLIRLSYPALGLGLWKGLLVRTHSSFHCGAPCKLRLENFLGLGLPLAEIRESLTTWLQRGSLPAT